jgi:hypothetical protein
MAEAGDERDVRDGGGVGQVARLRRWSYAGDGRVAVLW